MAYIPRDRHGLWTFGALLAGVSVTFPSFLIPGTANGSGPRTTDMLNLVSVALLGLAVLRSAHLHRAIHQTLIVWGLTLPWAVMEISALAGAHDLPVQRVLIRWLFCGGSAYLVTVLAQTPGLRTRLLFGLVLGVMFSLLTVAYDFLTFSPEDLPIEQLVDLAIYDGKDIHDFIYRSYGIFGHPNGAAGCVLIGVPIMIGAMEEGRFPRWCAVLCLVLIGIVFYFTKSRGPLIVSAALFGYWFWWHARGFRPALVLVALVAVPGLVATGLLGAGGGRYVLLERFLAFGDISVNAGDRWWTIATGFDLLLQHPLGMGSAYVERLQTATGTSATHNAYLELALMGGAPLLLFVLFRLARTASGLLVPSRSVEAWMAAYLLGIFAFESYFLQVNIPLMTLWLAFPPSQALRARGTLSLRSAVPRASRGKLAARPVAGGLAG